VKKITDINSFEGKSFYLEAEIADQGEIHLFKSEHQQTTIGYKDGKLFLDRSNSGNTNFQKDFASIESVAIQEKPERIAIKILVDESIIEIVSNDGLYAITDQVFPNTEKTITEILGNVTILNARTLKSIGKK
jgi:sucrose-6-phosphate hydrolase SacC (GH32 family)